MSTGTRFMVAVVAGLVLAGCAGCGGSAQPEKAADASDPKADGQPVDALAELAVPAAYDADRGWDQELGWDQEGAETAPVAVAPGSGTVAYVVTDQAGIYVQVRRATTGKVLWTSAAWTPPGSLDDSAGYGPALTAPASVTAVGAGGREYFVAWAHGLAGRDELHDDKEIVQAEVYAADASGTAVEPLRSVDVPVAANGGTAQGEAAVRDGGAGQALVSWADGYNGHAAAIDVTSGEVTTYDDEAGSVVGMSGRGLVANSVGGGFALIDSVRDDGTAYGTAPGSDPRVAVEIPASTGTPKALPAGTEVPAYTSAGAGIFLTWIEGGGILLSGRAER